MRRRSTSSKQACFGHHKSEGAFATAFWKNLDHRVVSIGAGGTAELRDVWEAGAFHLERLQAAEECVNAEQAMQASRQAPTWTLPFTPTWTPEAKLKVTTVSHTHSEPRRAPLSCCVAMECLTARALTWLLP